MGEGDPTAELRFLERETYRSEVEMANHASTRTTQLYDRRAEDVTLDEVERIGI